MNEFPVPAAGRGDAKDRLIGLGGVLFFGIWTLVFGVGSVLLVIIIATGTDLLAEAILLAVVTAAVAVLNGLRIRGSWRRLRGRG